MAKVGDLMMDFRPYVPGMPDPYQRRFLSIALDEFLTRSEVWQEDWDQVDSEGLDWDSAQPAVLFNTDAASSPNSTSVADPTTAWKRVAKVTQVYYKSAGADAELVPYVSLARLRSEIPNYQHDTGSKPQCWFTRVPTDAAAVGIYPRADVTQAGVLFPSVVYGFKRQDTWDTGAHDSGLITGFAAVDIPDFIYWNWGQAIVSGAVYRACMVPGRDWSNPDMAIAHRGLFEDGIVKAKSSVEAGFTNHTERVMTYGGY